MCLAVPGRVLEVDPTSIDELLGPTGRVAFGQVIRQVNFAYVADVRPGDYVIVHVGFAISKLDEDAARRTMDLVTGLHELESNDG